jgi:hypothetical protein
MPIIRSLQQLTLAYVTRVRVQDSGPEKACEIRYRKWDGTCVVRVFCVWSLVCFRLIFLVSSQIFHVFSNCSELIFYRFIPKTTDFPRVSLSHPHKTDVIQAGYHHVCHSGKRLQQSYTGYPPWLRICGTILPATHRELVACCA